jgi:hypothetical protein
MKVVVQKDWAGYKKSEVIEIDDKDVLEKGLEIGLFVEEKQKKVK